MALWKHFLMIHLLKIRSETLGRILVDCSQLFAQPRTHHFSQDTVSCKLYYRYSCTCMHSLVYEDLFHSSEDIVLIQVIEIEVASTNRPKKMSAAGRGKVRYVGGMVVAKFSFFTWE